MSVRSAAKAVIIQDGHVLCIRYQKGNLVYYGMPGGGQDRHEDLRETCVRECWEEISCHIEVGELVLVREFIGKRHARSPQHRDFHQVDHFFLCHLLPGSKPQNGLGADARQVGVEWLPLATLDEYILEPAVLSHWLPRLDKPGRPVYLGAVR